MAAEVAHFEDLTLRCAQDDAKEDVLELESQLVGGAGTKRLRGDVGISMTSL